MSRDSAYDITGEIDPVAKLDNIQSRLEKRRHERSRVAKATSASSESPTGEAEPRPSADSEAGKDAAVNERAANTAKKRRQEEMERKKQRQKELSESRWVTAGHKVLEKRVEHLERVYYRLKSEGQFAGNKQEFFDEGLAILEDKYAAAYFLK